jgi:hypothetical protein
MKMMGKRIVCWMFDCFYFLQVAVAPGGRWSRFKTYSTIQRTLEIWGFVIKFIFKSWLNRQKFSYKGLLFLICRLYYIDVFVPNCWKHAVKQ